MSDLKKAVVVDDDPKIVSMAEKALQRMGFEVFTAENGAMALTLVRVQKPHLLVSDILLPGMDGVELCKTIKEDPELSHIKVIMVTGVYNEMSFKLQMDCPADGFIEKPLDINKLEKLVGDSVFIPKVK
ncbi:MAG: response regulator [bacterium]|nr:response regulator [bacterium]